MQLISTVVNGTTLVLHSVRTLLIWVNLSKCYEGRITVNYHLIALLKYLGALITSSVSHNLKKIKSKYCPSIESGAQDMHETSSIYIGDASKQIELN